MNNFSLIKENGDYFSLILKGVIVMKVKTQLKAGDAPKWVPGRCANESSFGRCKACCNDYWQDKDKRTHCVDYCTKYVK
jgi:hypothetical protein